MGERNQMVDKPTRLQWARALEYDSAAEFARALDVPEVTYRAHEAGSRNFGERSARRYAAHLGVSWVWLYTGEGQPGLEDPPLPPGHFGETGDAEFVPAAPVPPGRGAETPSGRDPIADPQRPTPVRRDIAPARMPRDVEVLGTAVGGGDREFAFNGEVIDRVRRPPGVAAASGIFAVYVAGDSMAPRFDPGDLVYVNPHLPARPGTDVIVELHGADEVPGACYVKRYVRRAGGLVVLAQFNPPRDDIEIPEDRVKKIYRILTTAELLGI